MMTGPRLPKRNCSSGRGGRGARRRESIGRTAVVVVVLARNHDRDARNNGSSGRADDERAGSNVKLGLVDASGLARSKGHVGGESRSTNHRRHRNRSNNTLKTKHRLSPVMRWLD